MQTALQVTDPTKQRVLSKVEDPAWGKAYVFDPEPEVVIERKSRASKKSSVARAILEQQQGFIDDDDFEEEEEEEVYWCLPFFASSLLGTILEDTITEFRILVECNSEMRVIKTLADMYHHKSVKYGVAKPATVDELEGIDVKQLYCMEYKLNKLEADRRRILDLCAKLYIELTIDKCYGCLLDFTQGIIRYEEHYKALIEEEIKNKQRLKEVIKQLRMQRNQQKTVIYEVDRILFNLRSQVEDAVLLTETKGRYVDNWQAARTEQHEKVISNKESVFTNSMDYFKNRSDQETRVHAEVETLTNVLIDETLRKVEDWMDKYETDMEKIDLKIQIKRSDFQTMYDKRISMEEKYSQHAKAIKEWVHFKEERAKAQLYHDTMMTSAIIVQAWWRGLLVRKRLGPYRPKKGKGKKK